MITYVENFLTKAEADSLFESVLSQPAVREKNAWNNSVLRKIHYGTYSPLPESHDDCASHCHPVEDAPKYIKSFADKLSAFAGKAINHISQLGLADEKDHIGWHNHREDVERATLVHSLTAVEGDQSVYVISLGQIRELALRPAGCKDKSQWEFLYPSHGSLYVLPSDFNKTHEHAILDQEYPASLGISIDTKHIEAEYIEAQVKQLAARKLQRESMPFLRVPAGPPKRKKAIAASSTNIPTFGYPGGKARLARRIVAMLPPSGKRFVEAFAGRGNVYFAAAQLSDYERYWLNDLKTYEFFESVWHLRSPFEIPEITKELYEKYRQTSKDVAVVRAALAEEPSDSRGRNSMCLSLSAIFEQLLCYSGGNYYHGSRGKNAHLTFSREGFEKRIRLARDIMERSQPRITSLDYRSVLAECGEGDVVFLDPPYIGADAGVYSDKTLDHVEMVEILLKAKFKWVLSEYEQPLYIEAFGEPVRFNVQKLLGPKGASDQRAVECLWRNF